MRDLHIILAMAGRGSRFAKAGFTTPKPLILVDGTPMMLKALSSLEAIKAAKYYTIIIRQEHETAYNLSQMLHEVLPQANIVITDDEPTGATRDASRAKPYLEPHQGVIVLDCDLWFSSTEYNQMVEASLNNSLDIDGGLLTFTADSPRYSYAQIDANGLVTRTAEKVVISDRAITGAYFFKDATTFLSAADELMAQPLSESLPEYYLSPLYNILLAKDGKIKAALVDDYASFGTPEELAAYEAKHK